MGWAPVYGTDVPHRTLYLMADTRKNRSVCSLRCLPLPNRRGSREERALSPPAFVCRLGSTVWPPRSPPTLVCSTLSGCLSKSYPNRRESGLHSRSPEIAALRDAEAYWSPVECPSCLAHGLPACLPACLHACMPACLPACLSSCLSFCLSVYAEGVREW